MIHKKLDTLSKNSASAVQLAVRFALAGRHPHRADRQAGQRLEPHLAAPVFRHVTPDGLFLRALQGIDRPGEFMNQPPAAHLPVGALENNEEIVTANMADEIAVLIDRL